MLASIACVPPQLVGRAYPAQRCIKPIAPRVAPAVHLCKQHGSRGRTSVACSALTSSNGTGALQPVIHFAQSFIWFMAFCVSAMVGALELCFISPWPDLCRELNVVAHTSLMRISTCASYGPSC